MVSTADCFKTIQERFHDWFYENPIVLYGLIRSLKPQVVVEVGVYRGLGACYMARGLQENNAGHFYGIDDWSLTEHVSRYGDPKRHCEENLIAAGVRDWITLLDGKSDEVQWPEKVDFAYIDAWHSYECCKADCEKAISLGAEVVCFDDSVFTIGPRAYRDELYARGPSLGYDIITLNRHGGLVILMKKEELSRPVFSQELPDNTGVCLRYVTEEERRAHFEEVKRVTGRDFDRYL